MYKQAELKFDFIEEGIKSIKDKVDFNHPFETIFSLFLVPFVWASHPALAILLSFLSIIGYGPGEFGALIDSAFGFTKGKPDLSDGNAKSVAENIIGGFFQKLGLVSESDYTPYLSKRARKDIEEGGMFKKFWTKNKIQGKSILINILWVLIKTTIKGLIAIGITGAIGAAIKETFPSLSEKKPTEQIPSFTQSNEATDLYLNTKNNVEDTLIEFLDKSYKLRSTTGSTYFVFSEMFKQMNGYDLKGSKDMSEIVFYVDSMNSGDPNEKTKFVAPKIEFIAKKLIPTMNVETDTPRQIYRKQPDKNDEEKLLDALRGIYK